MISWQVMNKYPDHGYIVSQLLDYGVDKSMMSKQISTDLMTQHWPKGICNVDKTKSLES
jgi:hypothetical protein